MQHTRVINHFHVFCGLGGGARGFNGARVDVGSLTGVFRCVGGIDVDPASIRDFERLTGAKGTILDLFDREQYKAWHGHEPPSEWREATPADIRKAAAGRPNAILSSPPCKGYSGLLAEGRSLSAKYQALNKLALRGIWLSLEAFADDPPEFFVLENVPRISTRGRHFLDQIQALLARYGYAARETTHDCGELGGLAQSRKRFLLVARHQAKVPPFLYEPRKRPLQAVGTVLSRMPMPGHSAAGPMHRVPSLQWKTWVRLAFVQAGSDWRSLNQLRVENGKLSDYLIVPEMRAGVLGVHGWGDSTGAICGRNSPTNGAFSIADPRFDAGSNDFRQYGVRTWDKPMGTVIGIKSPGQGGFAIADPRLGNGPKGPHYANVYRIVPWQQPAGTITASTGPSSGRQCVADPRPPEGKLFSKYAVTPWTRHAGTVIGGDDQGAYAVADPRPAFDRTAGQYLTAGHYGVLPFDAPSYAVTASACHDNGHWSVADPRMPNATDKLVSVIRALDGTWHRPFSTLELAALQTLLDPEETIELDGLSDQAWRERIGNAIPPAAAQAVAEVIGRTLLMAWSGQTFFLDNEPIWVRQFAAAISLPSAPADHD